MMAQKAVAPSFECCPVLDWLYLFCCRFDENPNETILLIGQ
jgi:hypothetical protein